MVQKYADAVYESRFAREYKKATGESAGEYETLPHSPNKMFFYTRDYVIWLERKIVRLRKRMLNKRGM